MNEVDSLLTKYCPEGVERLSLDQLGSFYGGLTGKGKSDFEEGNAKYITYMNVYSNPATNLDINDTVKIKDGERQNKVEQGDVFFTVSSETPEECGFSSVIENEVTEPIYLNSFCCGFRIKDKSQFNFSFLKHVFRSKPLRQAICRCANGVTRFNISKKQLGKVTIPVPPLQIQAKIADILDSFTTLEAELEAELEARKKQYVYYREKLFDFSSRDDVEWHTLGEIGEFIRGNGLQKVDMTGEGYPCIHYGQIHTSYTTKTDKTLSSTSPEYAAKLKKAHHGDLLVATTSEDVEGCCKPVAWLGDTDCAISGDMYIYRHCQDPLYMSYLFQTQQFGKYKAMAATGAKVTRVSGESMAKFKFAFPSIEEQHRIASILNNFETYMFDISGGLTGEISARHKQYEYYRDQLLTFKRKEA